MDASLGKQVTSPGGMNQDGRLASHLCPGQDALSWRGVMVKEYLPIG